MALSASGFICRKRLPAPNPPLGRRLGAAHRRGATPVSTGPIPGQV